MSWLLKCQILRRASYSLRRPNALFDLGATNINPCFHSAAKPPGTEAGNTDWNKFDEFFSFTRGRFVVDEASQMKRRYIKFDMNELVKIAAQSVGARYCASVQKCPDGMYNKSFVLTMDDGQEVIAKVPNSNAGVRHYTTASEVATMDFVRNTLQTPVPKVYAWSSTADNAIGAEYIIMEKMPGAQLSEVWNHMKIGDKMQLRLNLALYQAKWLSISFCQFGALYYNEDLDKVRSEGHLYINQKGEKVQDSRFAIGPMTGRDWSDCGRAALQCDRGPWLTSSEYHKAVGLRELTATLSIKPLPKQTVMVCGPGLYLPSAAKKSAAIESYLKIYDVLLPDDPTITAPTLWHHDLHEENIFVDGKNPTKILGIIDWQLVDLLPLFDHNLEPAFVQYSGPKPETLELPELEDTSGMSAEERARATKEYFERALYVASRRIANKKLPAAYHALEYQQTAAFDLLTIARRLFEFGEAHFQALTVELRETWQELTSMKDSTTARQSPITLDDESLAIIEDDYKKAIHGMEIMNDFKARLGPLWPDKDAVSHDMYHDAKTALREMKDEVIQEFAKSQNDILEFEKLWPFDD
ncbi:phosphotransferase enzyme family protein [Fonsecaea pedrosoi]|nr:phosphotransferase enzyme family protein [Fonsecaea pedrosoi]